MPVAGARHRYGQRSPCRPRKGSLHRLQFAQEMAEMFAVPAAAAALLHPVIFGQTQRRFAYDLGHRRKPLRVQRSGIDRDATLDQSALAVVGLEHLAGIGPEVVDRCPSTAMAFRGAVTEPDD